MRFLFLHTHTEQKWFHVKTNAQCGNYRNSSHAQKFRESNFLLKRWFDEIFFRWEKSSEFWFFPTLWNAQCGKSIIRRDHTQTFLRFFNKNDDLTEKCWFSCKNGDNSVSDDFSTQTTFKDFVFVVVSRKKMANGRVKWSPNGLFHTKIWQSYNWFHVKIANYC